MGLSTLAVLLFVAGCASAQYKCVTPPATTEKTRPETLLPKDYVLIARTTDFIKSLTTETRETQFGKSRGIIKQTRTEGPMQWIVRENDFMFYDGKSTCSAYPKWTETATTSTPYDVPKSIVTALGMNVMSLESLLKQTKGDTKDPLFNSVWLDTNDTSTVGGLPTSHWISCFNSTPTQFIQVDVAVANSTTVLPPDPAIANPLLLQIMFRSYDANGTNVNLTEHFAVEISSVRLPCSEVQETFFLPPRGVYCNVTASKTVPAFPDKFKMRLQYTDVSNKRLDTEDITYDKVNKVVAFTYDAVQDIDEPLIGNVSVGTGNIHVVHDFGSGLQYVLSGEGDMCKSVGVLPSYAGDVSPNGTAGLQMKNATDFILGNNGSEFFYLGQRTADSGVPADVFISKTLTNMTGTDKPWVKTTVTELWYSLSDWTIETRLAIDKTATLLEIRQYHFNETALVNRTVQTVQAIINYGGRSTPWRHFDVSPCLKVVNDSYLFMFIKTSMEEVNKVGMSNFEDGLKEHIAKIANVSALRIVKNFAKEVSLGSDNYLVSFFNLADVSGVTGVNETSLTDAREAINKTISAGSSAEFVVFDDTKTEKKFSIADKALGEIPSTWNGQSGPPPAPPAPIHYGYSGGSMFVLAIFMIILGAGIGVGGAFFLWKRQRAGGLTYQVFE